MAIVAAMAIMIAIAMVFVVVAVVGSFVWSDCLLELPKQPWRTLKSTLS
jgi:cell division septal protein FtsQ